jgi:AcrR family transcriptional regulator
MVDEIKAIARRHLASEGANLSLRAVARDLGVVSSALYRYFGSRDELLTALIVDAYNAMGETAEQADAALPREDLYGRWMAVCAAIRAWAKANPHEYALIYGSPVPGYRAPDDTIGPASRPTIVLGTLLQDGVAAGVLRTEPGERLPKGVQAELRRFRDDVYAGVPIAILARGFTAWIQLFGLINFELFGRFQNVIEELDGYFEHQMRAMAAVVGFPRR